MLCVALIGFLAGWSPLHVWLNGAIGLILLGGALVGAILFIVTNHPLSGRLIVGLIVLLVTGMLAFGSTFGVMWYFTTYLPASGQPLFKFK